MSTGRLPSVDGGIQPTIVDAKGDLIVATAADTVSRLAVGSNDQVLTADSTTATGLKWAAVATPSTGANWSLLNAGGTALTGAQTVTVSGISGVDKIMVLIEGASSASSNAEIYVRVNGNTGSIYNFNYAYWFNQSTASVLSLGNSYGLDNKITMGQMAATAASQVSGAATFTGCNSSGVKQFISSGSGAQAASTYGAGAFWGQGYVNTTSTISSISVVSSIGNLDAGTVFVYTSVN